MFLGRGNRKSKLDPAKIAAALGADSFEPVQGDPLAHYMKGKTKMAKAKKQPVDSNLTNDLYEACKAMWPIVADAIMHGMPVTPKVAKARKLAKDAMAKAEGKQAKVKGGA